MKQAVEMDDGESFKWQNDVYVVVRREEDKLIVCRVASLWQTGNPEQDGWKTIAEFQEENFDPYRLVEPGKMILSWQPAI